MIINSEISSSSQYLKRLQSEKRDVCSYIFLGLFLINSGLLLWFDHPLVLVVLAMFQAFFFIGLQELKHQAVHRNFLSVAWVNDVIGMWAAALFGHNFIGYRYFHLRHHQFFCTEKDPEGDLYQLGWTTRWVCVLGAIEQLWVAYQTNRFSAQYVPSLKQRAWRISRLMIYCNVVCWCVLAWFKPFAVLWVLIIPFCLFAWLDFWFTQAEHYQTSIVQTPQSHEPSAATLDVMLPSWLSFLMLHRSLHRTHHQWPAIHWSNLRNAQPLLPCDGKQSMRFFSFCARWFKFGPRLWLP
jgi:fatty acid desaturase